MKKAWTKLLVACMAAMLAVGVCFAFTACDEGRGPHVDEVHIRFGQRRIVCGAIRPNICRGYGIL